MRPLASPEPHTGGCGGQAGVGIAFLIASNGLTTLVDGVAKHLTPELHGLQIVWGYFVFFFAIVLAHAMGRRTPWRALCATRRLPLHLTRGFLLVSTITLIFIGVTYMPLADVIAITFMAPLFTTALSGPLLGERVGIHRWLAVVAGLVGVVVVMQPSLDMHWATFAALGSALAFGLFQISTRRLSSSEGTIVLQYYTGFGGVLWSSLLVGIVWRSLTLTHLAWFAAIGLLGVAAHFCMIRAFSIGQVSLLAPFNYTKIIWAAALGYVMFGDVPASNVWIGTGIIVASGLYAFMRASR